MFNIKKFVVEDFKIYTKQKVQNDNDQKLMLVSMQLQLECFGVHQNIVDKQFGFVPIRGDISDLIQCARPHLKLTMFINFFRSDLIGRFRSKLL